MIRGKLVDKLISEGNFDEVATLQTRKVKWLFNNSNKLTNVIDEKIVRLIIFKLKERAVNEFERGYAEGFRDAQNNAIEEIQKNYSSNR